MAKWQKVKIKLRKDLMPGQREAVGLEIIEHIKKRTSKGKDKTGKPWKGKAGVYSKSYKDSLEFKIGKGSSKKVNLELSSEMMNSMKVLSHKKGEITIGYDKDDKELNGKVEGNRLGTYGNKNPVRGKARDFLGIERTALKSIQDDYDYRIEDRELIISRISRIKELLSDED